MDNELTQRPEAYAQVQAEAAAIVKELMAPMMASLAELLKNNTEAVQYLAAQQKVQTDRLDALERQLRLNTLVTPVQVKYINGEIKKRALEVAAKKQIDGDKKAVNKLSATIRKAVLARYGVAAICDIPKHEYNVVMAQIGTWNDLLALRDVTKEARARIAGTEEKTFSGLLEE